MFYNNTPEAMIEYQLKTRGIKNTRVLEAIRKVPRDRFVLPELIDRAYEDGPLPIGEGQTISQPYIVALMTELLELKGTEKVLEIGTGSGYQAAVLAELAREVYTIEILEPLYLQAKKLLVDLGYKNIKTKCGNGWLGWEEYAPYNAIIVTCAPPEVPESLIKQLAESGRMVVPVGDAPYQELKLIQKKDGKIKTENIAPVMFVPMIKKQK